jgi:hypothetical protein
VHPKGLRTYDLQTRAWALVSFLSQLAHRGDILATILWVCVLSSPLHPFRCLSSHLTWDLYHHPPIIRPTTQPFRPLLLVWLPCLYCGKPPIWGAPVKILPTPCAPRHVLPATFLGYYCRQIYIHPRTTVGFEPRHCKRKSTFAKRARPFTYFVEALGKSYIEYVPFPTRRRVSLSLHQDKRQDRHPVKYYHIDIVLRLNCALCLRSGCRGS